ncbi:hypothetical protein CYY_006756, partial [Polysphondylium violaceum]
MPSVSSKVLTRNNQVKPVTKVKLPQPRRN